eukprot:TRINITY_DN44017_c0_g1_i1.p1 TRINITY_DN44017_c0_g1~~TRINITY_DN44017_c0_g1_i1.p1  ORF type:complete len:264 (+),score=32.17 TRINITY_DN44017_c0_g1_i1:32-793(+)
MALSAQLRSLQRSKTLTIVRSQLCRGKSCEASSPSSSRSGLASDVDSARGVGSAACRGAAAPAEVPAEWWKLKPPRFRCTGCGACCRHDGSGEVFANAAEVEAMADARGLHVEAFREQFLEPGPRDAALWRVRQEVRDVGSTVGRSPCNEKRFACSLLSAEGRCTVYTARPAQCATYPFWRSILSSPSTWKAAAKLCEGIEAEHASIVSRKNLELDLAIESRWSMAARTHDAPPETYEQIRSIAAVTHEEPSS